ncbi:chemosensory receptor a [Plakobranchus ocellatus]|uniref:Chemosensory receptor a n=1 Tax=Plakobranchus ocellatus TaxID=259542 RepID=A0AAV4CA59_9GAST|nr:chemosensory receptor a [Plakobranchus ocellatus]
MTNEESFRLYASPTIMTTDIASTGKPKPIDINTIRPVLSAEDYIALITFLSYAIPVVAIIGIASNFFVIVICKKIGGSETINISYMALGISDLMASVIRLWGALCFAFIVTNTKLPFEPRSLSVPTSFFPGQGFDKTTAFITAFIALERCLCVQFPLHVKRIVTKRKTLFAIVIIYLFGFGPSNLSFIGFPFKWVFSSVQNRTILAAIPLETPLRYIISRGLLAYYGTILHFTALIIVWICTIFLAVGMNKMAMTRQEYFKHSISKEDKQKELRVIKAVFLLAVTYLACSTPSAATLLVPHFEPEFTSSKGLKRISIVCHLSSALLTQMNSSANFFILLYVGSKYRQVFLGLFGKKSLGFKNVPEQ